MSLAIPRRRAAMTGKHRRAAIAALAIADLSSLRLTRDAVAAAVRTSQHRHGGPDGVAAELTARNTVDPAGTARMITWADDVLDRVTER